MAQPERRTGEFLTQGYAEGVSGGWQVKAGMKIEGAGIGVTTLRLFNHTANARYFGIGFDIPADVAEQVAKQLIASGKVTRGYIGATVQDATQDMAESVGLGMRKAAIIVDTTPGGPSEKAGLQSGDIVLSPRESQIAALICEGKQNKQVAYQLALSEFTVENHLRRIYRKLGVHNRAAMTAKLFGGLTCQ